MSKTTHETVPTWDGDPRGWRRYRREVAWFSMATKKEARKFIAPKLVTRLTGPARLLAMGWNQQDLEGKGGLQIYMAKLSESPLVRRKLPNTAAVMQQYFSFKRHGHEAIANFLVREALHFEEFVEALHLLKDEKDGKAEEIFLPEETSSEEETGSQSSDGKKERKKEEQVDPAQSPTRTPRTPQMEGGRPRLALCCSVSTSRPLRSFVQHYIAGSKSIDETFEFGDGRSAWLDLGRAGHEDRFPSDWQDRRGP